MRQRVEFNVATLVHHALYGHAPSYNIPTVYTIFASRQSDAESLTNFGDRAYSAAGRRPGTICRQPQTAVLVIQPFQTVAEDIFVLSLGPKRSVYPHLTAL